MLQRLNENKDLIIVAIASFFIGFGAASLLGGPEGKDAAQSPKGAAKEDVTLPSLSFEKEKTTEKNSKQPMKDTNSLTVENQRAGLSVLVKKADLSGARWIVVRETTDDGAPGNVLGAGWFPAGMHENISVPLLRGMVSGKQYMAILFADTGEDKQFDHKVDQPVADRAGKMISAAFSTVASADGE